ncbi:MAG: SRPBCC domain-containing protein [Sphingomonas sp.]|nr:SRPBCC domain-containing protein [Sphingomonas sp.]
MSSGLQFEIACAPGAAFDGFSDHAKIIAWWGDPEVYRTVSWVADLRDGGHWRAEFETPDNTRFGASGQYLSVDRPNCLGWTWKSDWESEVEKTIWMTFSPSSIGTSLSIETQGHQSAEAENLDNAAWTTIVGWFSRAATTQVA